MEMMMMSSSTSDVVRNAIAVCGLLYIASWVWKLWVIWWVTPKKLEKCLREQGFSGNPYRLFIGDQRESGAMLREAFSKPININDDIQKRVLPQVVHTFNLYGKKSFMWVGRIPRVHITEPELVKEILSKHRKFHKNHGELDPVTKLLLAGSASMEDDQWAKHRRIINPAFHMENLKRMLPAFHPTCMEILSKWEKMVSKGGGSCELDVWPDFLYLAGDVTSRTLFGSSYDEGGKDILELIKELVKLVVDVVNLVYIPGRSRFFPTKDMKRLKEVDRSLQVILRGIISKRLKDIKAGEAKSADLLGVMLESNMSEMKEQGNKDAGLTIDEVIDECKLFYFAGQDTTSTLLTWTMFFLSRNPKWQDRAREEVLQLFGNETPNFEGLNRMKIGTMILNEVLRLYPPVVELTKMTIEETQLGNYKIPAGVQLMVPQVLIHYDTEIWGDDAKEFNPERFAEGVANAAKSQVAYFPFNWGPRICTGQNFALLEAKLALALILQRFSFDLSPSYVHAPYTVITLQPQYGAHMILRRL